MGSWLNRNLGYLALLGILVAVVAWLFPAPVVPMSSLPVLHLSWPLSWSQWPTILFLLGVIALAVDYFRLKRWIGINEPYTPGEQPNRSLDEKVQQRINFFHKMVTDRLDKLERR